MRVGPVRWAVDSALTKLTAPTTTAPALTKPTPPAIVATCGNRGKGKPTFYMRSKRSERCDATRQVTSGWTGTAPPVHLGLVRFGWNGPKRGPFQVDRLDLELILSNRKWLFG